MPQTGILMIIMLRKFERITNGITQTNMQYTRHKRYSLTLDFSLRIIPSINKTLLFTCRLILLDHGECSGHSLSNLDHFFFCSLLSPRSQKHSPSGCSG